MKECVILVDFFTAKKFYSPAPGIKPGPPGWKPGILAIRPRGITEESKVNLEIWSVRQG